MFSGVSLSYFIREQSSRQLPSIIHIYAPYIEQKSGGEVQPDWGGWHDFDYSKPPSPSLPSDSPAERGEAHQRGVYPLLVLDGPGELERTEQVRQIFLRNAVGTLVARNPLFPHILGLGLDQYPNFEILGSLLSGIRKGQCLRELYETIAGGMPKLSTESLHRNTGRLAPALWSADPDLNVILE